MFSRSPVYSSDYSGTRIRGRVALAALSSSVAMSLSAIAGQSTVTYSSNNRDRRNAPPGPPQRGKGGKVKRW
jgi:hypothetical protein